MADNGLHAGHRERMLKKYSENGINCFEDHEKLEILLYSVFSRINTNELSHLLLNRFGSLNGVLTAKVSELTEIDGIGEKAAVKIRFFGDFFKCLFEEKPNKIILDNADSVAEYIRSVLNLKVAETMAILFLDNKQQLIGRFVFSNNHPNDIRIPQKEISKRVVESECTSVIISHTHIGLPVLPSESDFIATRKIAAILNALGVRLLDHIIVAPEAKYSIRSAGDMRDLWG